MTERLTIRLAGAADGPALARLAALDSSAVPAGRVLVAEVEGELWAAVSLDAPAGVADPFRRSGELLLLLRERARQLAQAAEPPRRRRLRAAASRLRGASDAPLGETA
jgi:hypothetical protein